MIIIVGGIIMLRGSALTMLMFQITCSLMAGSAAVFLPALGGASITPAYLALCFLIGRLALPGGHRAYALVTAGSVNIYLVVFTVYGAATAVILPRIFSNMIDIVPLRAVKLDFLLQTFPLHYTSQNITTAVYLVGTLLAALAATVIGKSEKAPSVLVKWGAVVAGIHVFLGFSGAALDGTFYATMLNAMRNATYAQLDHSFDGMSRIKGIMPEASTFAAYAFTWFVFHFECWIRDAEPKWSGPASAALAAVLVFSTSSTAYVGLGLYAVILGLRFALFPNAIRLDKLVAMFAMTWVLITLAVVILVASPVTANRFSHMIEHMTVDKAGSQSGIQRAFWARQGIEAFLVSKGLGIGAGSFRSSSIFTAILGSMGVVGIVSFIAYLIAVLKPLRHSTFAPSGDLRVRVGSAASWTAFLTMIPAGIGAPSPNPGADFAIFAGLALVFRAMPVMEASARRGAPRPSIGAREGVTVPRPIAPPAE